MEKMGPAPTRKGSGDPRLSGARAQVLEHLQAASPPITVEDVATSLGLHANTARKHLEGLVASGLATSTSSPGAGRGRPSRKYRASSRSEPDPRVREYAALASALAGHISRTSADPEADALAAGEGWGRALVHGAPRRASAAQARKKVIAMLDDLGFDPQTNSSATTARLRRCPLLDAAKAFPDVVCAVHLGLVRGALDTMGADTRGTALLPFSEPGACRLHLATQRRRR